MRPSLVIDASAWIDLMLGGPRSGRVADRIERHVLHAPAHIDLEFVSAFGRLERAGRLTAADAELRLRAGAATTIVRHSLEELSAGAWGRRLGLRISEAFYVELADRMGVALITTDQRLARVAARAEAL